MAKSAWKQSRAPFSGICERRQRPRIDPELACLEETLHDMDDETLDNLMDKNPMGIRQTGRSFTVGKSARASRAAAAEAKAAFIKDLEQQYRVADKNMAFLEASLQYYDIKPRRNPSGEIDFMDANVPLDEASKRIRREYLDHIEEEKVAAWADGFGEGADAAELRLRCSLPEMPLKALYQMLLGYDNSKTIGDKRFWDSLASDDDDLKFMEVMKWAFQQPMLLEHKNKVEKLSGVLPACPSPRMRALLLCLPAYFF